MQMHSLFPGGAPPPPPQNPFNFYPHPFFPTPNQLVQNPNFLFQNPNLFPQQDPNFVFQNPNLSNQANVETIDRAVTKARDGVLAGGGHVAAWEVMKMALVELSVESWEALGVPMQQIPSLCRLLLTQGKINAFIHCFVAVQRITTLHDLNIAICNNEGVERYEELDLGPLLQHPLVMHYFSVTSDAKDILNITSEEIISCLCKFIDIHKGSGIGIEEFLNFVAKQRSVSGKDKLNVRIQSFGMYVTFIRQAKRLENDTVERCLEDVGIEIRSHFGGTGKHIQFVSPSLEDIDVDAPGDDVNKKEQDFDSCSRTLYKNLGSFIQPSHCSFPSAAEERSRLELKKAEARTDPSPPSDNLDYTESRGVWKRKRKPKHKSGNNTALCKSPKTVDNSDIAIKSKDEFGRLDEGDFVLDENSMRMFILLWKKKARRANSVSEVFSRMLKFYKINQRKEKAEDWFSSHPFIGLLNVAVISIACGMWDNMCNDFKDFSHHCVADLVCEKHTLYESVEVEPPKSEKTKNHIKDSNNS